MTEHDKLHPLPVVFPLVDSGDRDALAERDRRWSMQQRGAMLPWPGFAVIEGGKS